MTRLRPCRASAPRRIARQGVILQTHPPRRRRRWSRTTGRWHTPRLRSPYILISCDEKSMPLNQGTLHCLSPARSSATFGEFSSSALGNFSSRVLHALLYLTARPTSLSAAEPAWPHRPR